MKNTKIRSSNFELFRIVLMLFIIVYHFLLHAVIPNTPDIDYLTKPLITSLHIGVVCFVLISGYFGIKFSLNGFLKLFLYCSFYSILIYAVAVFINPQLFSLKSIVDAVMPTHWWFISIYLCLYLSAPIINIPLLNSSKKRKLYFILTLLLISFVFGQFIPSLEYGKNLINFVLIYYVGNYLRTEFSFFENISAIKIFIGYISFNIILMSTMLILILQSSIMSKVLFRLFFPYNSIGLLINSVFFFILFTRINIKSNIINWLAQSTLAVYLIHENGYFGNYLHQFIIYIQNQIGFSPLFILFLIIFGCAVLLGSILIDKVISIPFYFVITKITKNRFVVALEKKIEDCYCVSEKN